LLYVLIRTYLIGIPTTSPPPHSRNLPQPQYGHMPTYGDLLLIFTASYVLLN